MTQPGTTVNDASDSSTSRKTPRWPTRWVVVVGAAAMVLAIGTPLLGIDVFAATDILKDHPPWETAPPGDYQSHNPIFGDTVSTFLPLHAAFRRGVLAGRFPLWTQYPGGGHPLGTVPDSGSLGVLNLPYVILPFWYAPGTAKLAEMLVAAGFTFLFLRRVGLDRVPAILGGLIFSFSGFQVAWTNWPQSHVGALIPALFWSVERAIQEPPPRGLPPVALVVAAMLFEGFPSVTGYAVLASGAYALVRVTGRRDLAPRRALATLGGLVGAVVVGVGVAALQLLPFAARLGVVDLSYRVQSPDIHIPARVLAMLAVPNVYGSHVDRSYFGPMNYAETQSFIGASSLVLIVAAGAWLERGRVRRRVVPFLAIGALTTIAVLFVGGPFLRAAQLIPVFGLNFVGRLRSVMGFFLACLAALGLQALSSRRATPWWRIALVWGLALVVAIYGSLKVWTIGETAGRPGIVLANSILPMTIALAAVVAVWLSRRIRLRGVALAVPIIPMLFAVEAVAFAAPYWSRVPRSEFYPVTPAHRFFQRHLGHERLLGTSGAMYPGTTTYFHLRSLTTNNTLPQPRTWEDLIRRVDPLAFDPSPVYPTIGSDESIATSPILDRLGVRYFASPVGVEVFGEAHRLIRPAGEVMLAPSAPLTTDVPSVERLRGIRLRLLQPTGAEQVLVTAIVRGPSGAVLGTGSRYLYAHSAAGPFTVPVTEPRCAGRCRGRFAVDLSISRGSGTVLLAASTDGRVAAAPVKGTPDGLRLELAEGVVAYRRLTALPRVRWASRAVVVDDAEERVDVLASGLSPDTVLLNRLGPDGDGEPAQLDLVADGEGRITVRVRADGRGYVVVSDPIQTGWRASVDGRPAPIRPADHALVAVLVPEGTHEVQLWYAPPRWPLGLGVSGLSLGLVILVAGVGARRRRRKSR